MPDRWCVPKQRKKTPNIKAIVDTCALLDVVSCHDVLSASGSVESAEDIFSDASRKAWYRFERAGYGIRMAIHFHDTRSVTVSAGDEALQKALEQVPPERNDLASWFVRSWVNFTKPKLLRNWHIGAPTIGKKGTAVDDALLEVARENECPLITNEGVGHNGPTGRDSLREKAIAAGVRVMTTEEFARSHPLSRTRLKRFMRDFRAAGPRMYRGHRLYDNVQHHMAGLHDYYLKLLYGTDPGEVAERAERLRSAVGDQQLVASSQ